MKNTKDYPIKNQPKTEKDTIIGDVKNIHELPLFLASNPKTHTVQIELQPEKHPEGGTQERVINISALSVRNTSGKDIPLYLNTITLEFWFWLFYLWQQMPEPERIKGIVRWTRYQILTLMGRSTGGRECKIHDDHIERLGRVSFGIKDCFFNKANNERLKTVRSFTILSAVELTEMRDGEVVMLDQCHAVINPLLIENFLHEYTKPVNLSVYSSIHWKSGIARKLYIRLDTQFSHKDRFEMTTERFFRENGIFGKKYENPSARKQNLEKAVKQLLGKKFTSNKIIKGYKFEKTANGRDWKIIVWAHKLEVITLPNTEAESPQKKEPAKPTSNSKKRNLQALPKPEIISQDDGLVPIKEAVKAKNTPEKSYVKKSEKDRELKIFIDTFCVLFSQADKEKLYRSRSVKTKVREFINQYTLKKSLDFLHYCSELSKQNQFSMLEGAHTPFYLFSFKAGETLLVDTWLHDRASEVSRKRQEKEQEIRRIEYKRDVFEREKGPEYQNYINTIILELSPVQQEEYETYFQQKESEMLEEKGSSYKKIYSQSKLSQKQFSLHCLIEFSKEAFPTPVPDFYQWIKTNYPEEYKRLEMG